MLAREKPDVIFLQEFRCTTHKFLNKPNVRNRLIDLGYCFFINAVSSEFGLGSGYAGVAVLSKIPPLAWGVGVDRQIWTKTVASYGWTWARLSSLELMPQIPGTLALAI